MNIAILTEPCQEPLGRSIHLSNDEWLILSQCVEAFANSYRAQHSQVIATYVTRGQLQEASIEGNKMNDLIKKLDMLQVKLVS